MLERRRVGRLCLLSVDMLILFLATISGRGRDFDSHRQLGFIGFYPNRSVSTFVSLVVSIWKYFGRVVSGVVSAIFLIK